MARFNFGGSLSDFAIVPPSARANVVQAQPNATGSVYAARTGGSALTDLLDADGNASTTITSDADGFIDRFQGPDGYTDLWVDFGGGARFHVRTADDLSATYGTKAQQDTNTAAIAGNATAIGTKAAVADAIGGNIQATVRKLADDVNNVRVLVLGDSTAAQAGQWPYLLMPQVQALYPHRTLRQYVWGGSAYGAPTTVAAGTGSQFIDFYQGAVSGTVPESVWATMDAQVAAVQPDLILIHFGHNYGKNAADGGQPDDTTMDYVFRERMTRFIAEVKQLCPGADIMLNSQNPYLTDGARYQISNIRAQAFRAICADMGLAYGPILEAFLATGDPADYLNADLLHPTTSGTHNGAALGASALLPYFRYSTEVAPSARIASPFIVPAVNLLTNGNFADFSAPPALPGWTASAVVLSKNTTDYESKNGYSVKAAAAVQGTVANAVVFQALPIRRVRGQIITCAARFFIPTGQGSQPGRVQITGDGVTVTSSGTLTNVRDKWVWAYATARIPAAATFATFSILVGAAGPSTTDQCSVDRASAVLGHLPRDTD